MANVPVSPLKIRTILSKNCQNFCWIGGEATNTKNANTAKYHWQLVIWPSSSAVFGSSKNRLAISSRPAVGAMFLNLGLRNNSAGDTCNNSSIVLSTNGALANGTNRLKAAARREKV